MDGTAASYAKLLLSLTRTGARIGLDTSKAVFTLHCVDEAGHVVLRLNLRRADWLRYVRKPAPTVVAKEICDSSHHWARKLSALGHDVRLIPPQCVKPCLRRGKHAPGLTLD